ncbi:CAMK family protein kinase [Tritrichomonas foetus]|uniref:non-specific serine/threonine protein kinase n=1 Tax=Tritrichomonas foetus TaxID=1144522 RepID=A0A1J4KIW4_9EUKA|nr:CAMK family protein kinase [Tritrichomonas foetus]|eukprot:OHT09764.1 CAMK family protein kinase [Tritrichomonas foetus]
MNPDCGFLIGNYQLLFEIDVGGYASVWRGIHIKTRVEVAVKIIEKSTMTEESLIRLQREALIHRQLENPFIASLFDVFENNEFYFIIIELAEKGNFLDYINSMGKLPEEKTKKYFAQLVYAIEYLHTKQNIAHRDIKCENILLDKYGVLKLIDFGFSHEFTLENKLMTTPCGSPPYAAPEIIKGHMYTAATDIWGIGIFLYAMLVGRLPFEGPTTTALMQRILYSDPYFDKDMSVVSCDLISKLLMKNVNDRITIKEIKSHPWFSLKDYELIVSITNNYNEKHNDETIKQLMKIGYNVDNLPELLKNNEITDLTAAFRMLYRSETSKFWGVFNPPNTNEMKYLSLPPSCNSTHLRVSCNREDPESKHKKQRVIIFSPKIKATTPHREKKLLHPVPASPVNLIRQQLNEPRRKSKPIFVRPTLYNS